MTGLPDETRSGRVHLHPALRARAGRRLMHPAWHRYRNEPEVLFGLVLELGREIERNHELADWARQERADILKRLQELGIR